MQTEINYRAISGYITPKEDLAFYHPELKKTNSVYETVIVGYNSIIIIEHSDGYISYDSVLFKTENQAKKHLSTQYTTLLN